MKTTRIFIVIRVFSQEQSITFNINKTSDTCHHRGYIGIYTPFRLRGSL